MAILKLAALGVVILALPLVVVAAQGKGAHDTPASITVPPGHIGDRGVYTRYARASDSDGWEPIETQSFFVEAIEPTMNETGALRPSVVVRWGPVEGHPVVSKTSSTVAVPPVGALVWAPKDLALPGRGSGRGFMRTHLLANRRRAAPDLPRRVRGTKPRDAPRKTPQALQ